MDHEFTCGNMRCVSKEFKRDVDNGCGDYSDEQNCTGITLYHATFI